VECFGKRKSLEKGDEAKNEKAQFVEQRERERREMNAPQQTQEAETTRSWHLMRQEELRIEVDKDVKITLKVALPSKS
jgi:hypothetical protein